MAGRAEISWPHLRMRIVDNASFAHGFRILHYTGHLGYVTWTIDMYFLSPFPRRFHIKFSFDSPSGFRENGSLKMVVIYMYIAHGQGQKGQFFSLTHLFSLLSHLLQVFPNK